MLLAVEEINFSNKRIFNQKIEEKINVLEGLLGRYHRFQRRVY